jgi:hypothetical protein
VALGVFVVAAAVIVAVGFWLSRPSADAGSRSGSGVGEKPANLPAAGSCWTVDEIAALTALPWPGQPVGCSASHSAEIFYHNQVDPALVRKAAAAKGDEATLQQNLMYAQARRTCIVLASSYLGGNWHGARVRVIADWIRPQKSGYFGCAVVETADPSGNRFVRRSGSLKDALKDAPKAGSLAIDCVSRDGPSLAYAPCGQAHDGEFVGTYTLPPADAPFDETADGPPSSRLARPHRRHVD